jgi:hypothetical protein
VATVTRTATRTKTREQKIRNEHRRPPPGFIPGGGLRRAGANSAWPAHFMIAGSGRAATRPAAWWSGDPATRRRGGAAARRRGPPATHAAGTVQRLSVPARPRLHPAARWLYPPMSLSHTGPSRPHLTYLVHPNRTKHPSWRTAYVKRHRPPARRRAGGGIPGAGAIHEVRGAQWPGQGRCRRGRGDVAGPPAMSAGPGGGGDVAGVGAMSRGVGAVSPGVGAMSPGGEILGWLDGFTGFTCPLSWCFDI